MCNVDRTSPQQNSYPIRDSYEGKIRPASACQSNMNQPREEATSIFAGSRLLTACVGLLCILYSAPGNANPATHPWPHLYGQAGSYEVQTAGELEDMAARGMHAVIKVRYQVRDTLADAMRANGMKYVDTTIWRLLYWTVPALCSSKSQSCTQDPKVEQLVLDEVAHHLQQVSDDTQIIGFWVLDDYPGSNIRPILEKIHALVVRANRTSAVARPTICGVGVPLYTDQTPDPHAAFRDQYPTTAEALTNVSAAGCDAVAIYAYMYAHTPNVDPARADWSMHAMLPAVLRALKQQGWDPNTHMLIGVPQAFYYARPASAEEFVVFPRKSDVAAQTAAFCQAGAKAVFAFSWDDGIDRARNEPFNTRALGDGFQQGIRQCQRYW
jgi:hypothetical protein